METKGIQLNNNIRYQRNNQYNYKGGTNYNENNLIALDPFIYEIYANKVINCLNELLRSNYKVTLGIGKSNEFQFNIDNKTNVINIALPKQAFKSLIDTNKIIAYKLLISHAIFRATGLSRVKSYKPSGRTMQFTKRLYESIDLVECDIISKMLFSEIENRCLENTEYAEYARVIGITKYIAGRGIKGSKSKDVIDPVNRVVIMSQYDTIRGNEKEITRRIDSILR